MANTPKPVRKVVKKATAAYRKDPNNLILAVSGKREAKKATSYPVVKGKIVGLKKPSK
jgi:hypothetical protein